MARKIFGRRPISYPNRFHLYLFSVIHGRWRDYAFFFIKFLGLWLFVWIITTFLLGQFRPALLNPTDDSPIVGFIISISKSAADSINEVINSNEFIPLIILGAERDYIDYLDVIAYSADVIVYSAGAIISGRILIEMTWSKRVITIADTISLTTVHTTSDVNADDKGSDKEKVDDRCLVFRFATGGSELYDIKAVLDFFDETARINPIDPRINHPVFEIPEGNGTYSELIGVHELYFPFNTKAKNVHGKKLGDFYEEYTTSNGSNNMSELYATLRIIAKTANGIPVNASKYFSIFSEEHSKSTVFEGEFQPTLRNNVHLFPKHKRYHFNSFKIIELKPVKLTDLTPSYSFTYGETLTVTFTPKSGDEVVASGAATLKLGDTVLATTSEPQADGSFSLSYNTADKGVALDEQTLTVTFKTTGYEPATESVKITLPVKPLSAVVMGGLDKTWDGSDEVDGLAGTIGAAEIAGKLGLSGTRAFGETLTATYEPTSGEQVSYAWTRDGEVIDGVTGSIYTLTRKDVGARIAAVATASDANHTGSVTSNAVTVVKAAQDAPAAPAVTATSHTTIEVEALADSPAGAKAEYSIDGGKTWQTETTFTGLEPEAEYTVIARYQELDTHEASEASEGTTVPTPAAPLPTFTVSVSAEGQGTVDGGGIYEQGASVTVTATPAEGHHFVAWLVDGEQVSTEASYTFVVETDVALVAQFEHVSTARR